MGGRRFSYRKATVKTSHFERPPGIYMLTTSITYTSITYQHARKICNSTSFISSLDMLIKCRYFCCIGDPRGSQTFAYQAYANRTFAHRFSPITHLPIKTYAYQKLNMKSRLWPIMVGLLPIIKNEHACYI